MDGKLRGNAHQTEKVKEWKVVSQSDSDIKVFHTHKHTRMHANTHIAYHVSTPKNIILSETRLSPSLMGLAG